MTGTKTSPMVRPTARRAVTLAAATATMLGAGVALAHPTYAVAPAAWPGVPDVEAGFVLGVLVGVPVLLFVLITLAVYLPGLARGERVAPGATGPDDQWLGGRRTTGALAAAGSDSGSDADATTDGGASGRW